MELRDARLGNMPGGTDPAMATLASLSAEIDAPSLMNGSVVVRRAECGRALAAAGTQRAIWRQLGFRHWPLAVTHPGGAAATGRAARRPPISAAMPVIHDLRIAHSQVVFREIAGREHRVAAG